jgi:ferrous iron transport protein B
MSKKALQVALLGNPNTGKTSVFNALTGLNQKVGNYPGITVEKKIGTCTLPNGNTASILDLPGTYSLNTTSIDESIAVEILLNKNGKYYPDVAVVVVEVEHLKRNLLLFSQIKDLGIPTILVINMADRMDKKGISLDLDTLSKTLDTHIVLCSARKGTGLDELKELLTDIPSLSTKPLLDISRVSTSFIGALQKRFPKEDAYK